MPVAAAEPQEAVLELRPGHHRAGRPAWPPPRTGVHRAVPGHHVGGATRDWSTASLGPAAPPQQARTAEPSSGTRRTDGDRRGRDAQLQRPQLPAAGPFLRRPPRLPGEASLGLYTPANLYFPYPEITRNISTHRPDLYVAFGDQFYEHRPTAEDLGAAPTLDFLYRYYLWLWSFRELTALPHHRARRRPRRLPGQPLGARRRARALAATTATAATAPGRLGQPGAALPVRAQPGPLRPDTGAAGHLGVLRRLPLRRDRLRDPRGPQVEDRGHGQPRPGRPTRRPDDLGRPPEALPPRLGGSPTLAAPGSASRRRSSAAWRPTSAGRAQIDDDSNGAVAARRTARTLLKQARALLCSGDQHLAEPRPPRPRRLRRRPRPVRRAGRRQRLAALVRAGRPPAQQRRNAPHRRLHRRLRQPHEGPGRRQPAAHQRRLPGQEARPQRRSWATATSSPRATASSGSTRPAAVLSSSAGHGTAAPSSTAGPTGCRSRRSGG